MAVEISSDDIEAVLAAAARPDDDDDDAVSLASSEDSVTEEQLHEADAADARVRALDDDADLWADRLAVMAGGPTDLGGGGITYILDKATVSSLTNVWRRTNDQGTQGLNSFMYPAVERGGPLTATRDRFDGNFGGGYVCDVNLNAKFFPPTWEGDAGTKSLLLARFHYNTRYHAPNGRVRVKMYDLAQGQNFSYADDGRGLTTESFSGNTTEANRTASLFLFAAAQPCTTIRRTGLSWRLRTGAPPSLEIIDNALLPTTGSVNYGAAVLPQWVNPDTSGAATWSSSFSQPPQLLQSSDASCNPLYYLGYAVMTSTGAAATVDVTSALAALPSRDFYEFYLVLSASNVSSRVGFMWQVTEDSPQSIYGTSDASTASGVFDLCGAGGDRLLPHLRGSKAMFPYGEPIFNYATGFNDYVAVPFG
jgi:hypothetical protein